MVLLTANKACNSLDLSPSATVERVMGPFYRMEWNGIEWNRIGYYENEPYLHIFLHPIDKQLIL